MSLLNALLCFAILGSGVTTGLLFIFSNTVMSALALQDERHGMEVMQAINRIIINPLFLLFFMGTGVAAVAILVLSWSGGRSPLVMAGALTYLVGVLGLTFAYHIPRNDALEAQDSASESGHAYWRRYRDEWTRWNHVRSFAGGLSTVLLSLGLLGVKPW